MKQNVAMSFPTLKIPNSDNTVAFSLKSYHQIWCYTPTLYLEINEILNIFYFS